MIGNNDKILKENIFVKSKDFIMIAGPCAVESYEQLYDVAKVVKKSGANYLRGGAFKPRTSPYDFQGLGLDGLKILHEVGEKTALKTVSEVTSVKYLEQVLKYCDVIQVGSRNMQNYELLKEVGKAKKPVVLKRGMSSTINEWLLAAEYILSNGNYNVILCERGIRTFEDSVRNTLDISAVPVVKSLSLLPIIVDPTHACGNKDYVESLSLAAVAVGADGLMLEVHTNPEKARSDKKQQINLEEYKRLVEKVKKIKMAMNKFDL